MKIKPTPDKSGFGPGMSISLTGEQVAEAIDQWVVAQGIRVRGARTITVNGQLCQSASVQIDPSGHVEGIRTGGAGTPEVRGYAAVGGPGWATFSTTPPGQGPCASVHSKGGAGTPEARGYEASGGSAWARCSSMTPEDIYRASANGKGGAEGRVIFNWCLGPDEC